MVSKKNLLQALLLFGLIVWPEQPLLWEKLRWVAGEQSITFIQSRPHCERLWHQLIWFFTDCCQGMQSIVIWTWHPLS
jgi:hypothetical protein